MSEPVPGVATLFEHSAARLVKTIPSLQSPVRVNGRVPRDTLGAGQLAVTDIVLADVQGSLSVIVVSDNVRPDIATIALSVGYGQRYDERFVLPFRSIRLDADVDKRGEAEFDTTIPAIFPGLGAGQHGQYGGSFWFWEDSAEEGAQDRLRWSQIGVSSRAIWTVWILDAPSPIVSHIQQVLVTYPRHSSLPKCLPSHRQHSGAQSMRLPPLPSKPAHLRSGRRVSGPREMQRGTVIPPDYRNSLVAVDNETGQILGLLACDIALDTVSDLPNVEDVKESDDIAIPRQSHFVQLPPSCRTSIASAAFFSAAGSEYGDDEDELLEIRKSDLAASTMYQNDRRELEASEPHCLSPSRFEDTVVISSRKGTADLALVDFDDAMDDTGSFGLKTADSTGSSGQTCSAELESPKVDDEAAVINTHLPRSALRTDQIRDIEDEAWQQALTSGDLPIDGAYTHLAAYRPVGASSRYGWSDSNSVIEMASHDATPERGQVQPTTHAQMQGGSVLIEFLAGSRIGASIIGRQRQIPEQAAPSGPGVFGLVPMLPDHLLSFLGLRSSQQSDGFAIPSLASLFSEASDWVSAFFRPASSSPEPVRFDESQAEAWEYAIPQFDLNSLTSTPRPVYRRKQPQKPDKDPWTGYSVLHIDGTGVGRRAFFKPDPL